MTTPKSTDKSAQPMPGLSKRVQEQLKSRSFTYYAKARPSEKK